MIDRHAAVKIGLIAPTLHGRDLVGWHNVRPTLRTRPGILAGLRHHLAQVMPEATPEQVAEEADEIIMDLSLLLAGSRRLGVVKG
jgi:hypothetical protein